MEVVVCNESALKTRLCSKSLKPDFVLLIVILYILVGIALPESRWIFTESRSKFIKNVEN